MKIANISSVGLTTLFMLVPVTATSAQVVRYATDFPDAAGWTLPPATGPNDPRWDVDSTPTVALGAPTWHSPPNSLNYNNGTCIGAGNCTGTTFGSADSPMIDVSAPAGGASLAFWCMWDTELNGGCLWDLRQLEISNDGFQTVLMSQCYSDPICGSPGVWHQHSLALQPSWGTIQLRFLLWTGDFQFNDGAGWFVDDLELTTDCVPPASYCTAKTNSIGCAPTIATTGVPSQSGSDNFYVTAGSVLKLRIVPSSVFFS